jgi:uncharacterized membrane protein YkgB
MKYSLPDVDIRKTGRIAKIEGLAAVFLRYGLVVAIGWIAAMKVTEYEAKGIQPLIANSPFLSWGYNVWSVHHFTMIIGTIELSIAILIALRRWFPTASAVGSLGAVFMFLTTLSFIITTPGWEPTLGGFPALSGDVGEFLVGDEETTGFDIRTFSDSQLGHGHISDLCRKSRLLEKLTEIPQSFIYRAMMINAVKCRVERQITLAIGHDFLGIVCRNLFGRSSLNKHHRSMNMLIVDRKSCRLAAMQKEDSPDCTAVWNVRQKICGTLPGL